EPGADEWQIVEIRNRLRQVLAERLDLIDGRRSHGDDECDERPGHDRRDDRDRDEAPTTEPSLDPFDERIECKGEENPHDDERECGRCRSQERGDREERCDRGRDAHRRAEVEGDPQSIDVLVIGHMGTVGAVSPQTPSSDTRRLEIAPSALVLVVAAVAAAMLARTFFIAGRRPIGWVLAAAVAAAAISPAISLLSRRMKRAIALVIVLIPLLAGAGLVARSVYRDLDRGVEQLQEAVPEAAQRIEDDDRFGDIARSMDLHDRAERAVEGLEKPSSKVADRALDRGSTYLVVTILTVFLLIWGPKFSRAALAQITNEERRKAIGSLVETAFRRSQIYIDMALL